MILGIDTATRTVALGLARGQTPVAEVHLDGSQVRTRELLTAIDELLRGAALERTELVALGVGEGPGSFTGLRVGIAAAQGLSLGLGIPVVGVSTLECLALNAPRGSERIAVLIDAGRGEVFLGDFGCTDGRVVQLAAPQVLSPGAAADAIADGAIVLGDGWLRHRSVLARLLGDRVSTLPDPLSRPSGATIALLAETSQLSRTARCDDEVEPIYVRAPDAKLFVPAAPSVAARSDSERVRG